jgi:DNA-binding NarL/FixJ family response regulator
MLAVELTLLIDRKLRVIALTSFQEGDLVERALRAGAIGNLLKNVRAFEPVQAIRAAHAGHSILAQEATAALWRAYSSVACAARLCCPWVSACQLSVSLPERRQVPAPGRSLLSSALWISL